MQVNLNTQNKQSFTAFVTCGGAEQNLRKVLKPKDWEKFNTIVDSQFANSVKIHLFGKDGDKFYAKLIPPTDYVKSKTMQQLPFFESAISFFNRVAKKADAMEKEVDALPDFDIDKILEKTKL